MCEYAQVGVGAWGGKNRNQIPLRGVTGIYEPLHLAPEDQIQILCKSNGHC